MASLEIQFSAILSETMPGYGVPMGTNPSEYEIPQFPNNIFIILPRGAIKSEQLKLCFSGDVGLKKICANLTTTKKKNQEFN